MLPSKTLEMKGQRCHDGKHSEKHMTMLLCANADRSDKHPLLAIEMSATSLPSKAIGAFP
ncbi:hypothetical protein HPB49_008149 [Dermacentor silvarum]|uniref:Uncharacterized protein n=1 Tax=Dermacentor silvarum TaxID=543639 RepID=A0ACB8CQE4_DERSI|nr:hypothetical protein HPB49_008149 [Dermacentor silvarum]